MKLLRSAAGLCLVLFAAALVRAEPVLPVPAPAWTLKDVDGKPVSSEKLKGKVVVLDFWATWCAPCRAEIPGYVDLQKKYAKDGLVIVGVSVDDDPADVKSFIQTHGVDYQMVMADAAVIAAFELEAAIPTTFIIDRAGKIRDRTIGAESTGDFEKRLVTFLRRPVPYR